MSQQALPEQINTIKVAIEPLRKSLLEHPLYNRIKSVKDLQTFMEFHLFAVWDFMSLLKALQNEFTCTTLPWVPKGDPLLRRLINEIVHGEESDLGKDGQVASHYELYIDAMLLAGADISKMTGLLNELAKGKDIGKSLDSIEIPEAVKAFVNYTFSVINGGKPHEIASIFTFGREDLIPDMFTALVNDLSISFPGKLENLVYYLERHIELDGGEHGPLALSMVAHLCGNNPVKWKEAEMAAKKAIAFRIGLWDGIVEAIAINEEAAIES